MTTHEDLPRVPIVFEYAAPPRDPHDARILPDEPLPAAMRRMTLGQFDIMIPALTHPGPDVDAGIHTARKAMKRTRGLIRLVRDEIGYTVYRNENVVLRDAARRLAPARDGFVLIGTLDDLIDRYRDLLAPNAFADTRAFLRVHHRRAHDAVVGDRQLISDVVITLKAARARFAGGPALEAESGAPFIRDDFAAIADGLHRVHRRGRRAMRRSHDDGTTADFHEWRKRAKYLRYQMEALSELWPEVMDAHAAKLTELGNVLGIEHDLAVLAETIDGNPAAATDPDRRWLLLSSIDRRRTELQGHAFTLGAYVYGESSTAFVRRIGSYWSVAR